MKLIKLPYFSEYFDVETITKVRFEQKTKTSCVIINQGDCETYSENFDYPEQAKAALEKVVAAINEQRAKNLYVRGIQ